MSEAKKVESKNEAAEVIDANIPAKVFRLFLEDLTNHKTAPEHVIKKLKAVLAKEEHISEENFRSALFSTEDVL